MRNYKNNLVKISSIIFIFILTVNGKGLRHQNVEDTVTNQETAVVENSPELFELLFAEAKNYYVEALIGNHFTDTTDVKFCLDRTLEIVAEISELDSLTMLQRDDFRRFCEKLNSDFKGQFSWVNGDEGSFQNALIEDDLSKSLADTIDLGGEDKLIVLEDEEGNLPVVTSAKIERIIKYFQTKQRDNFQQWLQNADYYEEIVRPILKKEGLPEYIFYLALIESGYKTNAYSHAHAAGPWQFIASTGAYYGLKRNWWVDERRDIIKATVAAAQYLSDLHDYFDDWYLAMAAYNCGKLNVLRAIRREGTRDYWKLKTLPRETRNYIPSFMAGLNIAKDPEKYGFQKPENTIWEFETVLINGSYELESLAKMIGVSAKELKEYNPELRRWVTPPDEDVYKLKVPKTKGKILAARLKDIPKEEKHTQEFVTIRVQRGQNLSYLATKYGSTVSAIVSANNIRNVNQLKIGQYLRIPKNSYNSQQYVSTKSSNGVHTVKKGDSLYEIARAYGVSLSSLRSRNNLYGRRFIYPGQKLYIPGTKATAQTATTDSKGKKVFHIVKKGESLSEIADQYKVSLSKVRYWNNIYGRKFIYPGQKVTIYQ